MPHSRMCDVVSILDDVTVIILVGGLGTRLRSVVSDRPKVLAQVRDKPFLAYLLEQIADAGVRYVVLCIGYQGEQVQATFGDAYAGMSLVYSQESTPLGTAGALRSALPLFRSDPVLVMNGDSFCRVDLSSFWTWHRARAANATLLLTQVSDTQRYGRVQVGDDGHVLAFEEKSHQSTPGLINAGIYSLSHRLLKTIPPIKVVSLEREIFPAWIGRGLYGYRSEGSFLDIGTPEGYALAELFFVPEPPA